MNVMGLGQATSEPPSKFSFVSWNLDGIDERNLKRRTKAVCKIIYMWVNRPTVQALCNRADNAMCLWGWSRLWLLCWHNGYVSLAMLPHVVCFINVCHLWLCITLCRLCACTDIAHFSFSLLTVGKHDKSNKLPVFVCLSGLDFLHSHVSFILDKRTNDLCVCVNSQCHLVCQVALYMSWVNSDNDLVNIWRVYWPFAGGSE